jgi:hypothetical protein
VSGLELESFSTSSFTPGLHRRRRPAHPQVEERSNGVKNAGSSNNASTRANSSGNFNNSGGNTASHSDT